MELLERQNTMRFTTPWQIEALFENCRFRPRKPRVFLSSNGDDFRCVDPVLTRMEERSKLRSCGDASFLVVC